MNVSRLVNRYLCMLAGLVVAGLVVVAPAAAAPPANDTFAGAVTISTLPFSDTVDTTEATTDADDANANANCGAPATDASVWYAFTPASATGVSVDVSASDYNAGVIVVTGSPGSFGLVASCANPLSSNAVPVVKNPKSRAGVVSVWSRTSYELPGVRFTLV
jgi:hypothetical protein